jgi:hypothetical protein
VQTDPALGQQEERCFHEAGQEVPDLVGLWKAEVPGGERPKDSPRMRPAVENVKIQRMASTTAVRSGGDG